MDEWFRFRAGPVEANVVATYNDALLAGWSPGGDETISMVADIVGVSRSHVLDVVAHHLWAASSSAGL